MCPYMASISGVGISFDRQSSDNCTLSICIDVNIPPSFETDSLVPHVKLNRSKTSDLLSYKIIGFNHLVLIQIFVSNKHT